MPGRQFNANGYRYGFNGKEKDDESNVNGGSYDFGARVYDSRLGRFLSIDPEYQNTPDLSTYLFASNSPVAAIDENGESATVTVDKESKTITIRATLNFYGPIGALKAKIWAHKIEKAWNKANAKVQLDVKDGNTIKTESYKVKFVVHGKKISEEAAKKAIEDDKNAENNYIKVQSDGYYSFSEVKGNTGNWKLQQIKKSKNTIIHEFGHLLGWLNPFAKSDASNEEKYHDYKGTSTSTTNPDGTTTTTNSPGILTPGSGTVNKENSSFDSKYYDSSGDLDDNKRPAPSAKDVGNLNLNKIITNGGENGKYNIKN